MKSVNVHFLGASGTVTGSKYIIETANHNIMIDCGMFQGQKELRALNWENLPFNVESIDVILLTHGHLDHVGYLPRIVKQGFKGKIISTEPTLEIAKIILRDSGKINEEDAERANKEEFTQHNPAKPFYTVKDAETTIKQMVASPCDQWYFVNNSIKYKFNYNGHILGATFIEIVINSKVFAFSGDVGRTHDFLLKSPNKPQKADYLFLESTYGDTLHSSESVSKKLVSLVYQTINNRGNLIIPSFAVERLQTLMYILWKLYKKNKIPNIPIFIDSPMGNNVLSLFERFPKWHKIPLHEFKAMQNRMTIITSYGDTWKTIDDPRPKIVIAGSGMVTGGRVLTYLKQLIDNVNTTILLVGYQAQGTRGRQLLDGEKSVKFFGKWHEVKAKVEHIESLSAHADQAELLAWLSAVENKPTKTFLVHGEALPIQVLKQKIESAYQWQVVVPKLNEVIRLEV